MSWRAQEGRFYYSAKFLHIIITFKFFVMESEYLLYIVAAVGIRTFIGHGNILYYLIEMCCYVVYLL
jgi:hypothetical protein